MGASQIHLLLALSGPEEETRKRTRRGSCAHDPFTNTFPCIHPPLSAWGGTQRISRWLELQLTFCLLDRTMLDTLRRVYDSGSITEKSFKEELSAVAKMQIHVEGGLAQLIINVLKGSAS